MNKILVYTFNKPNQISYKICDSLSDAKLDKFYLGSLSTLRTILINNKYEYCIGLGDNRLSTNLKIESIYTNKFGNLQIIKDGKKYIETNLVFSKINNKLINRHVFYGFCNRAAYSVANFIGRNKLLTRNGFIHVPSKTGSKGIKRIARKIIEDVIT